jgi:hypothetical protein
MDTAAILTAVGLIFTVFLVLSALARNQTVPGDDRLVKRAAYITGKELSKSLHVGTRKRKLRR